MNGRRHLWALPIAAALAGCAGLPTPTPPTSFAPIVARAAASVVAIADSPPETSAVTPSIGANVVGSGFRVSASALIATAAHVVHALRGAPVVEWQAQRWPARVKRIDEESDLALLEIDAAAPIPGLVLATRPDDEPGNWVLVLGRPFGTLPTATVGIVSARAGAVLRPAPLRDRLQLNAAINPGNSGGPVVDLNAEVIGIANATVPAGYGLGFAVPVAALRRLIDGQLSGTRQTGASGSAPATTFDRKIDRSRSMPDR
jgi:serine protease Do